MIAVGLELDDITQYHIRRLRKEYEDETGESISVGKLLDIGVASIIYIQAQHDAIGESVSLRDLEVEYDQMIVDYKKSVARRMTSRRGGYG